MAYKSPINMSGEYSNDEMDFLYEEMMYAEEEKFPLWNLPVLARAKVFEHTDPGRTIALSFQSKRVKRFLMAYKIRCQYMFWKFDYDPQAHGTRTLRPSSRDPTRKNIGFTLHFAEIHDTALNFNCSLSSSGGELKNVNGKMIEMQIDEDSFLIGSGQSYKEMMQEMKHLATHILDICHVESHELDHEFQKRYHILGRCFIWSLVEKFDEVSIHMHPHERAMLTQSQLEKLTTKKIEKLELIGCNVENPKALKKLQLNPKKISIEGRNWLTIDHLISSKSEEIDVDMDLYMDPWSVLKIVEKWQSGEKMENLKQLEVTWNYRHQDVQVSEVVNKIGKLRGISRLTSQEKYHLENGEMSGQNLEDARKMERLTDDRVAILKVFRSSILLQVLCENP